MRSAPAVASAICVRVAPAPIQKASPWRRTARSSATASVETRSGKARPFLFFSTATSLAPATITASGCSARKASRSREARRSHEALPLRAVVERPERRLGLLEPLLEAVRPKAALLAGVPFAMRGQHGVADGAVAGAAAEVARELVGQCRAHARRLVLARGVERDVAPVVALEHRRDDARRAEAALRAVGPDHRGLHRVGRLARPDPLDGQDLAPREHRQQRDARVDGPVGPLPSAVDVDHDDRARPAIPLAAPLLGTGQPLAAQVLEQGGGRRDVTDRAPLAVQDEVERSRHASAVLPAVGAHRSELSTAGGSGVCGARRWACPMRRPSRCSAAGDVATGSSAAGTFFLRPRALFLRPRDGVSRPRGFSLRRCTPHHRRPSRPACRCAGNRSQTAARPGGGHAAGSAPRSRCERCRRYSVMAKRASWVAS